MVHPKRILEVFSLFSNLRVGVIGDFALDIYLKVQNKTGENSVETGKEVSYVSDMKASLGAAGNVVNNLHALMPAKLHAFGIIGDDLVGREVTHLLKQKGVETKGLLYQEKDWTTYAYMKPFISEEESNRLDFGTLNNPSPIIIQMLLEKLHSQLPDLDVVIMNQQFASSFMNEKVIQEISNIATEHPRCSFIADLRDYSKPIQGIGLKVNLTEVEKLLCFKNQTDNDIGELLTKGSDFVTKNKSFLLITCGENGIIYLDSKRRKIMNGITIKGKVDSVGAGDACLSAFSLCMRSGASLEESLEIANIAAAVTVKKINQTGRASLQEIIDLSHHT